MFRTRRLWLVIVPAVGIVLLIVLAVHNRQARDHQLDNDSSVNRPRQDDKKPPTSTTTQENGKQPGNSTAPAGADELLQEFLKRHAVLVQQIEHDDGDALDSTRVTRMLRDPSVAHVARQLVDIAENDQAVRNRLLKMLSDRTENRITREFLTYVLSYFTDQPDSGISTVLLKLVRTEDSSDLRFSALNVLLNQYLFEPSFEDGSAEPTVLVGNQAGSSMKNRKVFDVVAGIAADENESPRMRYQAIMGLQYSDVPALRRVAAYLREAESDPRVTNATDPGASSPSAQDDMWKDAETFAHYKLDRKLDRASALSEAYKRCLESKDAEMRRIALSVLVFETLGGDDRTDPMDLTTKLLGYVSDPDPVFSFIAVEGIAKTKRPVLAVQAAATLLQRKDIPTSLKLATLRTLDSVPGKEVHGFLRRISQDSYPDNIKSYAAYLSFQRSLRESGE